MSTQEQNTPRRLIVDFDMDAVNTILKALNERINTRNLRDEKQNIEFKRLLDSSNQIKSAMHAYLKKNSESKHP